MRRKALREAKLKAKLAELANSGITTESTTTTTVKKEVVEEKIVRPVVEKPVVEEKKEEVKPVVEKNTTAVQSAPKPAAQQISYNPTASAFRPSGNSELDAILKQALARKGRR